MSSESKIGLHLSWENIDYILDSNSNCLKDRLPCFGEDPNAGKQILHSISGDLPPAQLMAVMGSSGAGKTTFLNALSNQLNPGGTLTGTVFLDGVPVTSQLFRRYCGYVRQDDVLLPNLTVRETLTFYAYLRLPSSFSKSERSARIDETLSKLGLTHVQDTLIGGVAQRGISGGEKRRVSIAVELIRNPRVIFLDEPTSGLDSRTSLSVVQCLADLAHQHNHTIICTVHQPRNSAFHLFDQLLLLAHGKQIYSGPLDDALGFFGEMGHQCPEFENPADFYIDLLTLDTTSVEKEEESKQRIKEISATTDGGKKYSPVEANLALEEKEGRIGAGRLLQIYLITKRSLMNTQRHMGDLIGRIFRSLVMGFMISILWWQLDNDQSAIQDRFGLIFLTLMGAAFPEIMGAIFVFALEREVFRRERRAGMYNLSSYYIAKQLAEFPMQVLAPASFAIVIYICTGLPKDIWIFGTFLFFIMAMSLAVSSMGLFFGAMFPAQVALIVLPSIVMVSLLIAGFYVHPDNLPTWIAWAQYCSFFYYSLQGLILNQFEDFDFYCKDDQFLVLEASATCMSGEVVSSSVPICPITSGNVLVEDFGSDQFSIWQYQMAIVLLVIVFRILLYPALRFCKPKEIGG